MARHLDKFTKPFETSGIPFLLAEVITNGAGEMVDLFCRFLNPPAAALLDSAREALQGQRFTHIFPADKLPALAPLATVAFSGSSLTFSYTTVLGRPLNITCYQPMYGMVACLLEQQRRTSPRDVSRVLSEKLPGAAAVLELSRQGVRNLSFTRQLCQLSGYDRKEFLLRFSEDFSALVAPSDWPDLLQALLDSARDGHGVNHSFRLLRSTGEPLWMDLRAEPLPHPDGTCVFHAVLLDVDGQTRDRAALAAAQAELSAVSAQLTQVLDTLPCGYCILRLTKDNRLRPVRVNRQMSELLGYSPGKFLTALSADPLWCVLPADRGGLCAAADTARTAATPLRQSIRVRRKDGGLLCLRVEATWHSAEDGGRLLHVACFDATREQEAEDALQSRLALCELLVNNSNTVCLDYLVSSGIARVECGGAAGGRSTCVVPNYLEALDARATIHADDRKVVAANLQQLCAKPGAVSFIYRGNYDGQGWRWYQASCVGLPGADGTLCRVLGKAEDVSERMSAAEQFHERSVKQGRAMAALCRRDYHLVLTVEADTGHFQYLGGYAAPPGDRYQDLGGPPLESVRAALETVPCYPCTSSDGLFLKFSWLNKSRKLILLTASLSE